MPAIPVETAGGRKSPCLEHGCSLCCYETEMPLSEADVARLVSKGHARNDFVEVDENGYLALRNVPATAPDEGHHCFFLKGGQCSVYADRPEGCRYYPITVTPERRVVRDEDCPHRAEFPTPPGAQRRIQKLLNDMARERDRRRKAA